MKSEWAKWKLFFNMVLQPFLIDRKILVEYDANEMFLLHLIMALFSEYEVFEVFLADIYNR